MSEPEKEPWIPIRLVNMALDVKDNEIASLKAKLNELQSSFDSKVEALSSKMKDEVTFLRLMQGWTKADRLSEANDRLIKAGDAMCDLLGPCHAVREWNKAKRPDDEGGHDEVR